MGYGSRALQALNAFYSGEYYNFDADIEMGDGGKGKKKGSEDEDVCLISSVSFTSLPSISSACVSGLVVRFAYVDWRGFLSAI